MRILGRERTVSEEPEHADAVVRGHNNHTGEFRELPTVGSGEVRRRASEASRVQPHDDRRGLGEQEAPR